MIRRIVIAEELNWRRHHRGRRDTTSRGGFVPAPEIAGIYRDLRKGMEDAKNEPGAADFYFGEMEMRRLVGRKPTGLADAVQLPSSRVERAVLCVYWIVSGYSSRSSRDSPCSRHFQCSAAVHRARLCNGHNAAGSDRNDRPDQRAGDLCLSAATRRTHVLVCTRLRRPRERLAAGGPRLLTYHNEMAR